MSGFGAEHSQSVQQRLGNLEQPYPRHQQQTPPLPTSDFRLQDLDSLLDNAQLFNSEIPLFDLGKKKFCYRLSSGWRIPRFCYVTNEA